AVPRFAAAIVIDSFDTPQSLAASGPPAGTKTDSGTVDVTAGTILGGERDVVLSRTSANAGLVDLDVSTTVASGLAYASGSFTTGVALMSYDGNDDSATSFAATGLGGVDLTGGASGGAFHVVSTSDLGATLTITVFTNLTTCSVGSLPIPADPTF